MIKSVWDLAIEICSDFKYIALKAGCTNEQVDSFFYGHKERSVQIVSI